MENLHQTPSAALVESASEGALFVTSISELVLFIGTMGVVFAVLVLQTVE